MSAGRRHGHDVALSDAERPGELVAEKYRWRGRGVGDLERSDASRDDLPDDVCHAALLCGVDRLESGNRARTTGS